MTAERSAWYEAVVEEIRPLTPSVRSVRLRPSRPVSSLPGQHVDVRLTAPDGYTAVRSYSICSAPPTAAAPWIELAVERLHDGEVSPWFHDVAARGDTVELRGPATTHFVWQSERDGSTLLIGGGSGVAPFMSMARHRATLADGAVPLPRMLLLVSARAWDEVIFREELLAQERAQPGFRLVLAITRGAGDPAAPRGADYTRRIDEGVLQDVLALLEVSPGGTMTTFVCGNNGFVNAVTDTLLSLGVQSASIRTERYGE
ncbi:MAG: FAD-binding oxidoreductase [Gemmatimonadota bacterium]